MGKLLRHWRWIAAGLCAVLVVGSLIGWPGGSVRVKSDERIVFFPTSARLSEDGARWILPIHGWIFEPEEDAVLRRATIAVIRRALGADEDRSSLRRLISRISGLGRGTWPE